MTKQRWPFIRLRTLLCWLCQTCQRQASRFNSSSSLWK